MLIYFRMQRTKKRASSVKVYRPFTFNLGSSRAVMRRTGAKVMNDVMYLTYSVPKEARPQSGFQGYEEPGER